MTGARFASGLERGAVSSLLAAFLTARFARLTVGGGLPPPLNGCVSTKKESAVKPGSVVGSHSSGMRVAAQL